MMHKLRLAVVPAYLLLCLILGGASAAGAWANMALQLTALAIIVWAVAAKRATPMSTPSRQGLGILILIVLLIGLQLVPLPPSVWSHLPGRAPVAEGFRMLGQPLPWLPLSLEPYRTLASGFWLLPAIAIFLGIVRLGAYRASWMAWVIAVITIASVAIGALQIAGGDTSPWYFYRITNHGQMVGFFSNANHLATLLVATIPFLAALYLRAASTKRSVQKSSALFVILSGTVAVVFVGIIADGSLAGIGLVVPVLAATVMMLLSRKRRIPVWWAAVVALLLLGSVAAVFSGPFQNNLTSASAQTSGESRHTSFSRSSAAARDFLPVGSGLGTFQQIYRTYEDRDSVDRFYMNHVHGDYIELALETGLLGLAVLLLFLLWWVRRVIAVWRAEEPDYFARAASIASAAILAHSAVDYPLRTAAIGAVFALCCALLAEPRSNVRKKSRRDEPEKQARHLSAD
jgi:O-antigen ligase